MKKVLYLTLVILMAMGLAACTAPSSDETVSSEQSASVSAETPDVSQDSTPEATDEPVVVFTDAVLEELVRSAMGKPEGDITLAEAEAVTELDLQLEGGAVVSRVSDLDALKYFTNLTNLNLSWTMYNGGNDVDISPLAGLTKLEGLSICCDDVADISTLAGMTNMKGLWIWGNGRITDISALAGMTNMEDLWIKGNQITDISALAGMENLWRLYMEDNQVTDISSLSGMTKLTSLLLSGNPVEDYSPLGDIYPNLTEKDFELN